MNADDAPGSGEVDIQDAERLRAEHLISIGHYEEATSTLLRLLARDTDDPMVRCLLAETYLQAKDYAAASDHAKHAVRVAGDQSVTWYVAACVFLTRGRLAHAAKAIAQSIKLDPHDPDAHAIVAQIAVKRKDWRKVVEAADTGLRFEADHEECTNLRAVGLTSLGRKDEAARTLRGQLARSPEDPLTHANQGLVELHRGRYAKAKEHFLESLRLEPENEPARRGLVEALKAHHWLYRPVLRYFLWIGALPGRMQVAILGGAWLVNRICSSMAEQGGALQPLFQFLNVAYFVFVVSSWFASPLANSLLCLSIEGRRALTTREKASALIISSMLGISTIAWFGGFGPSLRLPGLVIGIAATLPMSIALQAEHARTRQVMIGYALLLSLFGAFLLHHERAANRGMADIRPRILAAQELLDESQKWKAKLETAIQERTPLTKEEHVEMQEITSRVSEFGPSDKEQIQGDIARANDLTESRSLRLTLFTVLGGLAFIGSQFLAVWLETVFGRG